MGSSSATRASAKWGLRFGRSFANALKRRRPQPGDKWYMDEVWDCPGLVDTLSVSPEVLPMPRTRPPYSPEFRRQMVDLVRAGRNPDDLAREFEPSGHSIRAWVAQADRNEGRREEAAPGLTAFERDELTRLRRENKQLRLERDILSKAAAWFARETGTLPSGSSGS